MFTLEDKPFSLNDCVAGATNFITPEAHRKQLSFVVSLSEGIPEIICGDQFRLRQVLVNLLGNAVKFTDKGKVELRVKVGPTAVGGKLRLIFSVRDTGIGIHGEQIGRLFQPFSQADESHNRCFGGAGLGLAISKEIVEMMGGTISLTSEEGKWSDFTFTVPFAEARLEDETPGGAAPPENATRLAHAEANKRRILIAEDNEISRDVLLKLLTRHDYQVDFAENGREAVELWQECAYDLILMDIQMPRMNGFQATKAIRESERARGSAARTPIVAMTAHAAKEDEHRCLVAGMDGHISKPIDLKETLDTIAKIFAEQALT